jgi:DNA-binding transcriptional LysR family regulator
VDITKIDIRHLRYFVAAAEAGSLTAAAISLHISQPPLTRKIHQLEDILQVTLMERLPRGIALTVAGETFLAEANNILSLVEQAALRTQEADKGQLGRLDVGIFGSAIYGAIPTIIREFRRAHPKVAVALHNLERHAQLKALRERRLTVGFNRFFSDEPGLTWETVHSERLNIAIYKQHSLNGKKMLKFDDIAGQTLILYPKNARPSFIDHLQKLFQKQQIEPGLIHEVDDVTTAIALVSSGIGITVVTESACNLRLPNIQYIPLEPSAIAIIDLDIIYRSDDRSPLLHAFLRTVHKHSADGKQ